MHTPDTDSEAERRPERQYPTVGADATELATVDGVETESGDLLVYERDDEEAWLQSDVHADREDLV